MAKKEKFQKKSVHLSLSGFRKQQLIIIKKERSGFI
jgi:hypothetical protein